MRRLKYNLVNWKKVCEKEKFNIWLKNDFIKVLTLQVKKANPTNLKLLSTNSILKSSLTKLFVILSFLVESAKQRHLLHRASCRPNPKLLLDHGFDF